MKPLILFGKGLFAEIALQYFTDDSEYKVIAFTLDDEFIDEDTYLNLPVIKFSEVEKKYPPSNFEMFICLSYTNMNKLREKKYFEAKEKGYNLVSYISSKCTYLSKNNPGDNCFIFENNTIQPFVKIGNNIIIWSGNHIGHHSTIKDHNFISSHVVVSGNCIIESNSFLGVNSTIGHNIVIEKETLIGAGSIITKNTEFKSVYVPAKSIKIDKQSDVIKL